MVASLRYPICSASTNLSANAPYILAITNQKGGVGKTTTAINLGAALAELGHKTLLVDLDPQGNASTGLGIARARRRDGTYTVLHDPTLLSKVIQTTAVLNLTLLAADRDLAGAEIELVGIEQREFRLREALKTHREQTDATEFVLIDCPPSLGLLTLNGLVAADAVLIPLQCEFFALEGVGHLTQTIERLKRGLNRAIIIEGIVLTMYDRRNNLSELVAADARAFFGTAVFNTIIPRNVRVSEAPSHGKPVLTYDTRSIGAQAYRELAREVIERRARHHG